MSFIHLQSYSNYIEANIALGLLEEEGIRCHVEDESSGTIMHMSSGFRLMVYSPQAERAAGIIKNVEREYLDNIECPDCHQRGLEIKMVTEDHESDLRRIPMGRFIARLSKMLSKEGTTMQVKHYVCRNCGKEFNEIPA